MLEAEDAVAEETENGGVPEPGEAEADGFAALGLSAATLRGVAAAGFEAPTPVQVQAIPVMLAGRDLVAQALTGTGKTAAFGLPMIERIDVEAQKPQALVLAPTRELAIQVAEALYILGRESGLRVVPIYGGQPIDRQLHALRRGAHVIVGTPGRLLDHLRRGSLELSALKLVVLDEADEMLAMGFIEDVETILEALPAERQTALFSATIPPPIAALARRYLRDPHRLAIEPKQRTVSLTRQSYYEVLPAHKVEALSRILDMETPGATITFCRTRREVDELSEALRARGYLAEALHGEMGQPERDRVMRRFREGSSDLLIATDVAARGLDIENVTHVINYDIPWDADAYIHRIGRTGRAGRAGEAITLVSPRERRQLAFIERGVGVRIKPMRLPTAADIAARRRELFKQSIVEQVRAGGLEAFLQTVEELAEEHDAAAVAAAALKLLWEQQKGQVGELGVWGHDGDGERPEIGMTRLFLTLGRRQGLRPGDLVGALKNEAGIPPPEIGAIDIMDNCAFLEVPEALAAPVIAALGQLRLRGRRVRVQRARPGALGAREGEGEPPADPIRPGCPPQGGRSTRPGARWEGTGKRPRPPRGAPPPRRGGKGRAG
jgi:ATP-dependent RNA helicase DeaD